VRTLSLTLPGGRRIEDHAHAWAQLIYASEGVMTVTTDAGSFVVPSRRAVWAPAGAPHSIETTGRVSMRTLYVRPDAAAGARDRVRVVAVSPLLREAVLRVVSLGTLRLGSARDERLLGVTLDELEDTGEAGLELLWPIDHRARGVAARAAAALSSDETLAGLARGSGASARTLERAFRRETGLTFGRWRQRARLLEAMRLLATGEPVSAVAPRMGYRSVSAFVAMFRRSVGTTPGRCFARLEEQRD